MLNEKIKLILKLFNVTNEQIAAYSGCSVTNLSRMSSGSRTPDKSNPTMVKFIDGVCLYAEENYLTDKLKSLIGSDSDNEYDIRTALENWLYEGICTKTDTSRKNSGIFSRRLKSVMELADLDSNALCKAANIDISYVNRMRRGDRIPKENSKLLDNICNIFTDTIKKNGELDKLAEMLEISPQRLGEIDICETMKNWLRGKNDLLDIYAAEQTLRYIMGLSLPLRADMLSGSSAADEKALGDTNDIYIGAKGLRRAVTRFLASASVKGNTELLLYSDQDMRWMKGRFERKWLSLMTECAGRGVRIKIIHNIDRDISEILFAVKNWLPLYMTGLIESYYCIDSAGSRFSHTMFISPECSVDGFCTKGSEENSGIYRFGTDPDHIKLLTENYERMLRSCRPLVTFSEGITEADEKTAEYGSNSINIRIGEKSASVIRLSEPKCTFTFTHPLLIQAFGAFTKNERCNELFGNTAD